MSFNKFNHSFNMVFHSLPPQETESNNPTLQFHLQWKKVVKYSNFGQIYEVHIIQCQVS